MYLLTEITSFLADNGFNQPLEGLQPLTQWEQPTAFRVFFKSGASPRSLIVKHIREFEDTSVAEQWRPRWKVAQDYINLSFLAEVADGEFAPRIHAYSEQQNMLAIEDLGNTSLFDVGQIPKIGMSEDLWQNTASTLARLVGSCPADLEGFERFAHGKLEGFATLRKWDDQDPDDCHSIVGVAREMDFSNIDDLSEEVSRLQSVATQTDSCMGYSVGDLWHQHVMFHGGQVKFIDFHCGGYDIVCTDLMRLIEGTPLYQDRPLPPDIVTACKDVFFKEFSETGRTEISREVFEQVYEFCLLRHVSSMVAREIVQLRRKHQCALVTKAVGAALSTMKNSQLINEIVLEFLTELEKLPNEAINADR